MTVWSVVSLDSNTSDGGVFMAHWRATLTSEEGLTASTYGSCSFNPDSEAEGFVAYEELTEETVLGWVFDSETINKDTIEAALAADLDSQKTPVTRKGTPWTL